MNEDANSNKAVLYLRCTVIDPKTDPIFRQRDHLRQEAEREGLEVVGEYMDVGCSGRSIHSRPGLRRLLDDARVGMIRDVLVLDLTRLSRGPNVWELVEELRSYGVRLHSSMEQMVV